MQTPRFWPSRCHQSWASHSSSPGPGRGLAWARWIGLAVLSPGPAALILDLQEPAGSKHFLFSRVCGIPMTALPQLCCQMWCTCCLAGVVCVGCILTWLAASQELLAAHFAQEIQRPDSSGRLYHSFCVYMLDRPHTPTCLLRGCQSETVCASCAMQLGCSTLTVTCMGVVLLFCIWGWRVCVLSVYALCISEGCVLC